MADDVTKAVGVVVGIGVAVSPFVFAAVSALRGMIDASWRRVALPVAGVLLGWIFAALVLIYLGAKADLPSLALVALAGFWAYAVSAGLNAQGKTSREGPKPRDTDGRG
jgi:hypothetical protein